MQQALPQSIVFMTGTFISHACWVEWIAYFEKKGYKCIAPAWPHKDASAEDLRNTHYNASIATNRLESITEYFAGIVAALPEKPILIGHSLGGLVVQFLLQRGLASAGVAVHSFPPAGVSSFRFSLLRTMWEAMSFFTSSKKSYMVPFRKWKRSFANNLSCEQQKEFYYKYAIPESKGIIRDVFKCTTRVNFRKAHAPLLFTSGGRDRVIPPCVNYVNQGRYKNVESTIAHKHFKDHGHLVFDPPAAKEEAEFIHAWLQRR